MRDRQELQYTSLVITNGIVETRTTVNHAMSHRVDLTSRSNAACFTPPRSGQ